MPQTKCISGNATKNNGAVIAQVGNVATNGLTNDVSMAELKSVNQSKYGSAVYKAVSAASSGNIGTALAYSSGPFSSFNKNQYIMMIAGTHIAGAATTRFRSPSNQMAQRTYNKTGRTNVHTVYLTAFSFSGNVPTYTVTARAPDFREDTETTTLGSLIYRTGKPLPTTTDYGTQNSH